MLTVVLAFTKDYITHAEYTADMFEVYKNIGVLVRRISELETLVKELMEKQEERNERN